MGPTGTTTVLSNALLSLFIVRKVIFAITLCSGSDAWMHRTLEVHSILFTQFILSSCSNTQQGSRSKHYMHTLFQLYFPAIKILVNPVYYGHCGTNHKCHDHQSVLIFQVSLYDIAPFEFIIK